jgi:tetratricopeptide (TPR) repeat protein
MPLWRHRSDLLVGWLAAAIPIAVYLLTLCPTVYVGDSGELTTAAAILGIPHPPGYPLYVFLGFLFSHLIPVGSFAWRLNLFSAACAGLACSALYFLARRLDHSRPVSLGASLTLAFSLSFWGQAVVARVYCLSALLLILLLDRAVSWYQGRKECDLVLAAAIGGLGLANHTVILAGIAATILLVLVTDRSVLLRPKLLLRCAVVAILGVSLYLYLPLRSLMNPTLDWANPETPGRLWNFLMRRDYWNRVYVENPADVAKVAWFYVQTLPAEFLWLGVSLVIFGIYSLSRKDWRLTLLILFPFPANIALMALHGSWSDIFQWRRYMISGYVVLTLALAWALASLTGRLPSRGPLRWVAALLLPALLLVSFWRVNDRSRHTFALDYAAIVLSTLPRNAVLIAQDDNVLFPLIYVQLVERWRPDVKLVMQGVQQLSKMKIDLERKPVYFTHWNNLKSPDVRLVPEGVVYHLIRAEADWSPVLPWQRYVFRGVDDPTIYRDYLTRNLIAGYFFMEGINYEFLEPQRAARAFERAGRIAHDNDVTQYNLGLAYARDGRPRAAYAQFLKVQKLNPRHLPARDRLAELRARYPAGDLMGVLP